MTEDFILDNFNNEEEILIITELFRECHDERCMGGVLSHRFKRNRWGTFFPVLTQPEELVELCETDYNTLSNIIIKLIQMGFMRRIKAVEVYEWTGETGGYSEGYMIRAYLSADWKELVERFEE